MRQQLSLFLLLLGATMTYAADTVLQLYRPFTDTSKQLPFEIIKKKEGDCFEPSKIAQREDAWRCYVNRKVYDPCFVNPFGKKDSAVCPASVWNNQSVEIMLKQSLDNKDHKALDMSSSYPWAIELVSGEKCNSIAVNEVIDGMQVHYRCNENMVLIGHVQRCENLWHILKHDSNGVSSVDIAKAWF